MRLRPQGRGLNAFGVTGATATVLQGLYKFAFQTVRSTGRGVMFATADGKLYGGNSGYFFIGSYSEMRGPYPVRDENVAAQSRSELCVDVAGR